MRNYVKKIVYVADYSIKNLKKEKEIFIFSFFKSYKSVMYKRKNIAQEGVSRGLGKKFLKYIY